MNDQRDELDHEREKAKIRAQSHALVWRGTPEELSATIVRWHEMGWLEAESREEALNKASIHFVRSDGTPAILPMYSGSENRLPNSGPLPGATIYGADINDWVGWNGEAYVLRQTKEMILADENLKLIGSVKELSGSRRFGPGMVTVVTTQPQQDAAKESSPLPIENAEVQRRAQLLAEYKSATGNPSNKRIYEANNGGIYKPEFYRWLAGKLPSDSATTIAFERFLKNKKPPIPRKPKP